MPRSCFCWLSEKNSSSKLNSLQVNTEGQPFCKLHPPPLSASVSFSDSISSLCLVLKFALIESTLLKFRPQQLKYGHPRKSFWLLMCRKGPVHTIFHQKRKKKKKINPCQLVLVEEHQHAGLLLKAMSVCVNSAAYQVMPSCRLLSLTAL